MSSSRKQDAAVGAKPKKALKSIQALVDADPERLQAEATAALRVARSQQEPDDAGQGDAPRTLTEDEPKEDADRRPADQASAYAGTPASSRSATTAERGEAGAVELGGHRYVRTEDGTLLPADQLGQYGGIGSPSPTPRHITCERTPRRATRITSRSCASGSRTS